MIRSKQGQIQISYGLVLLNWAEIQIKLLDWAKTLPKDSRGIFYIRVKI